MALGSTIYTFDINLADVDRGVYETLNLRVAQHPSETQDYLLTRVMAYCLQYTEGVAFSKGLSDPDEPAIAVRDLTGVLKAWIDIGLPEPARLHRASKAAPTKTRRYGCNAWPKPRSIVPSICRCMRWIVTG